MRPPLAALLIAVATTCTTQLGGCGIWPLHGAEGTASPSTLDGLYRRGAAALAQGDLDTAIAQWRLYARQAPPRALRTRQVRGYLTLLQREAARRYATRVAAGERDAVRTATDRLHVALFPFASPAAPGAPASSASAFNRAVVAMITSDLAKVPALTVLERERIDALVQELKLAGSGLVDPATAAAPGRLLGAGTVVAGAVLNESGPQGPGSGRYRIDVAITDVPGRRVVGTSEADGRQAEFFVLQKRITYGILAALDIRDLPPGVHRVHTRSWEAYARFAAGLQALAEDRYDVARTAFAAALAIDPAFLLAEDALLDTPERAATLVQIQVEVRAAP